MSDKQWQVLAKHFAEMNKRGRPREHSARNMINAIFHIQATGCQWHALPKDYPPCKQVCNTFARWRRRGVRDVLLALLRQQVRAKAGRQARPSTAIIDSQSVKTVSKGGSADMTAGKRVKGRKRHIASDTMGLLLAVVVHSTGIQDRAGVRALQIRLFLYFESLKTIFVDGSYSCSLINWALSMLGWNMQVIKRCQQRVFRVLPKRWVVQRAFAWLSQSRRMSKDYEVSVASAEAFIKIACIRRMVRPLR
ncbi:IS5 family transposase [Ottowia cancrivicina]|uniref:IS5 family transposase n=1 Tax=Ottowia cancrivicina TaxID=3040346 RepID=A0AAW6RGK0_9BURK|nr:IS5 family transposase [Ottowia sp. 10c7w1]MDG9699493.1 IS5 family transposase [Ottowia sp. 10c7w1]